MQMNRSKRATRAAIATLAGTAVVSLLSACVSSQIEEVRHTSDLSTVEPIQDFESIVVLTRRTHTAAEAERSFTDCVNKRLDQGKRSLRLTPQTQFVDMMFPYFEPRLAPNNPYEIPALLEQPGVVDRINGLGVRYIIWIDGSTETVDQGGSMTCALSPGGGGCLGINWWEREASYEASIWDLKDGVVAGTISADASGTSYMPALIIPIPLIARTGKAACHGLATQIEAFLVAEDLPAG